MDTAEQAFLDAQEYDPAADYAQPAQDDEEEEYDPDTALPAHPPPAERTGTGSPSDQSASMSPESAAPSPQSAPPASATPQPAASTAAHTSPAKQLPPRTMGGFVVESEDEEDEAPTGGPGPAGSAGLDVNGISHAQSHAQSQSQSLSPSNALAPSSVPVHSANDLASSGVSSSTSAAANDANPAQSPHSKGTPVPENTKTQAIHDPASARPSQPPATPVPAAAPVRLPQDRVGLLEDRIAEDPRGDIDAWLGLIQELRRRHKIDEVRALFDRFLEVFPTAAEQWNEYAIMELELEERKRVERVFERSIATNPYVPFWQTYINYVRRTHNMETDPDKNRPIITQVYEFTLDCIGIDYSSGRIWTDYIDFLRSSLPGVLGGTDWRDLQKMDTLRKVYHRAVAVPTTATMEIWKEYNSFELHMNKATGRKHLQEQSPSYMTARSAKNVLDNITKGINRTTLPPLPPLQGCQGYDEYMTQVKLWSAWIQWEKDDPLVLKDDKPELYHKRVIYLYKQALMALRFWPELWYEAAEWCYANNLTTEGDDFLAQGIDANPENCLLAFRQAHQIELKGEFEEGEAGSLKKGDEVRKPYMRVLDELYRLHDKIKKREEQSIARTKESFAAQQAAEDAARNANMNRDSDDDDDAELEAEKERRAREREEALKTQIAGISAGYAAQLTTLKKTISYAWIALMRAMRRIQGKGRPDPPAGQPAGFRGIFSEARKRGKLLSDAYVASALIEHYCYGDPAANKIFERGMKLFPQDEGFALEYVRHLVKQGDVTNARAVFETVVTRITSNPSATPRVKRLFAFFHDYESQFGELTQIVKLESRMRDLFPEDPQLAVFKKRYSSESFDPTNVRPVISLRSQMRPLMLGAPGGVVQSIEEPERQAQPTAPAPAQQPQQMEPTRRTPPAGATIASPRIPPAGIPAPPAISTALPPSNIPPHITNSPKRPYDDADNELAQPRKMVRAESPLKGAAGRRLDAARRNMGLGSNMPSAAAAPPLPREINFLMSIIPGRKYYHIEGGVRLDPARLVDLFRRTTIPATLPPAPPGPPPNAMQYYGTGPGLTLMSGAGAGATPAAWGAAVPPPVQGAQGAQQGYGGWGAPQPGAGAGGYGGYGGGGR